MSKITFEADPETFTSNAYKIKSYPGIAWYVLGWELVYNEDPEWSGEKERSGKIVAVMVGDDRKFIFEPTDIKVLNEDEYCHSCGQIGCEH